MELRTFLRKGTKRNDSNFFIFYYKKTPTVLNLNADIMKTRLYKKSKGFLLLKTIAISKKVQERATNIANAILGRTITIERELKKNKSITLAKEKIKQRLNL